MDQTMQSDGFTLSDARQANGFVFCSGQIGLAADGTVPAEPEQQFAAAFAALAGVLRQNGCDLADVVDLTSFHVGYPAHMPAFMKAMGEAMPGVQTAWTAIGVAGLGYPGSLVEIKAIACPAQTAGAHNGSGEGPADA